MKILNKTILICILLSLSVSSFAQYEKLHAAFIYNFTKYLEWPVSARNGDFIIGVVNKPEMVTALNTMVSGKLVGSQKIIVKKFNSINDISNCHIVFIPTSLSNQLGSVKSKVSGNSTLVASVGDGLAQKGADISFILVADKLNFEMNRSNISGKGITVSSRLEQLAAKVY